VNALPSDIRHLKSDIFLLIYHLAFAGAFTWYIQQNGGDARGYWEFSVETVQDPGRWMSHWGTRSYFIQWLNFIPARVLGLPFWLGNVLYAMASFWAIRELWRMVWGYFPRVHETWFYWLLWLIFLLPNLHFWSSGIGKESLSLVGLVMFMKGSLDLRNKWYWLLLGITLSYMVRPLQGGILLAFALPVLWLEKGFPTRLKWAVSAGLVVLGLMILRFLLYITHIEILNMEGIARFSEGQMAFLDGFGAGSAVPMSEYSWGMKIWTLFFRPFIGEASGFWQWVSALENLVALLMGIGFMLGIRRFRFRQVPGFIWIGIAFGLILTIVYALTLNNLGIIMRMKSVYMVFFYLLAFSPLHDMADGGIRIKHT
jgi:hypothetical protein